MSENPSPFLNLEDLWDALLSRQPEQVRIAFRSLEPDLQRSVLAHLQRMTSKPGWHTEQRLSAQAALEALQDEA